MPLPQGTHQSVSVEIRFGTSYRPSDVRSVAVSQSSIYLSCLEFHRLLAIVWVSHGWCQTGDGRPTG